MVAPSVCPANVFCLILRQETLAGHTLGATKFTCDRSRVFLWSPRSVAPFVQLVRWIPVSRRKRPWSHLFQWYRMADHEPIGVIFTPFCSSTVPQHLHAKSWARSARPPCHPGRTPRSGRIATMIQTKPGGRTRTMGGRTRTMSGLGPEQPRPIITMRPGNCCGTLRSLSPIQSCPRCLLRGMVQ